MRLAGLFLVLLWVGVAVGPASARQAPPKYWIFLADKADAAGKSSLAPVSEAALLRRTRRGDPRRSGALDLPVSGEYLSRLRDAGATPLVASRWLNAVSARLDGPAYDRVRALPFVRELRLVGSALVHDAVRPPFAPIAPPGAVVTAGERPTPFAPAMPPRAAVTASAKPLLLDYGSSITQLTIAGAVAPIEAGLNGAGVRLGIIDTGIGDMMHPAIKPILDSGRLLGRRDFTGQADDGNRHAMSVLSMAAGFDEGHIIGPAYGAYVLHARTEYVPSETNQEEDNFVAGIEWMESEGVDVVNVSLGYSTFDAGQRSYTYSEMDGDTPVTTRAADIATSLGVVMVIAAGNEGCTAGPPSCWYYITSPADGDSVLAVGAVTPSRDKATFSGFGPSADGRFKPDVAAMGQGTTVATSSLGQYGYTTVGAGTSFAAPMVSGVVALLLQADPDLTPAGVIDALRSTAGQAGAPDNRLGWGIIDAAAAVARVTTTERMEVPENLILSAWPNPFRDGFRVTAALPLDVPSARLEVFDTLGRLVATYERQGGGSAWQVDVNARDLPAGLLHMTLAAGLLRATGSIVKSR